MTRLPSFLAYCDLGSVGPANDWNSRRSIAEELKRRIDQEIMAVAIQKPNVLFPPDYDDEGCQGDWEAERALERAYEDRGYWKTFYDERREQLHRSLYAVCPNPTPCGYHLQQAEVVE